MTLDEAYELVTRVELDGWQVLSISWGHGLARRRWFITASYRGNIHQFNHDCHYSNYINKVNQEG